MDEDILENGSQDTGDSTHLASRLLSEVHYIPDADSVRDQVESVLSTARFRRADALSKMLRYIVTCDLDPNRETPCAYSIAVEALGRNSNFDPQADPIVRVQANRLRKALATYYHREGKDDPVLIEVPNGAYRVRFSWHSVPAITDPGAPRLVVMPFLQTGQGDFGHFRLGIPYQIIDGLLNYKSVRVVALESVLAFEDKIASPFILGHALGAEFAMTGEFTVENGEFQCGCRLLKLDTHHVIWSERFAGDLAEFNPNDIIANIANRIAVLTADDFGAIPRLKSKESLGKRQGDVTVYDAILRYYDYSATLDPAKFAPTLEALESAVAKAPSNAEAWAGLAIILMDSAVLNFGEIEGFQVRSAKAACHAVRLSPGSTLPRIARIYSYGVEGKVRSVIKECRDLLQSNPMHDSRTGFAGFFLVMAGMFDEGLAAIASVRRASCYAPTWYHFAGFLAAYGRGDTEGALVEARSISMPDLYWHRIATAAALGRLGLLDEAAGELAALLELNPGFQQSPLSILKYLVFKESLANEVLDGLHQAGLAKAYQGEG